MKPKNLSAEPKFISGPNRTLVGMGLVCTVDQPDGYMKEQIPKLWTTFYSGPQSTIPNRVGEDGPAYGLIESSVDTKGNEQFFYLAGVEVRSIGAIPKGMVTRDIVGGKYAIFTYKGLLDKVQDSIEYIVTEWLPASGKSKRDAAAFEYYDQRFMPQDLANSEFDIYIPIT